MAALIASVHFPRCRQMCRANKATSTAGLRELQLRISRRPPRPCPHLRAAPIGVGHRLTLRKLLWHRLPRRHSPRTSTFLRLQHPHIVPTRRCVDVRSFSRPETLRQNQNWRRCDVRRPSLPLGTMNFDLLAMRWDRRCSSRNRNFKLSRSLCRTAWPRAAQNVTLTCHSDAQFHTLRHASRSGPGLLRTFYLMRTNLHLPPILLCVG